MGNEAKTTSNVGGGGFKARMEHYIYSGEKKHVMAGIAIVALVFGAPWFLMNRGLIFLVGTKHQSHQDYMEKADKARSQRLSSSK
uniref:GAG1At protein n=1 Tax=Gossypium raimondii TaxID=29730 RepID=A0A0D2SSF1_GOSRA|nr:hypothetical protein B456_010G136700 [Gossypium raimondii]